MKAGYLAVAAAIATGVSARNHAERRHGHAAFHEERHVNLTTAEIAAPSCGCTTVYYTVTGAGVFYTPPATLNATTTMTSTTTSTSVTTQLYTSTVYPSPVVPTPFATTCPTPGVYTVPATTVVITETTVVCGATSTTIPAGPATVGGSTITVTAPTTVTVPYASVSTSAGVVTSTILTTTYVCPASGTYTIGAQTTSAPVSTVWVYPTPATYAPGTYTQPEVVTTITETNYVIFCPFTSSEAPVPTTSAAPVVVPTTAAVEIQAVASTTAVPVVASTSSAAPVASSSSSSPSLGNSGNQWAITYTPYTDIGGCKAEADVATDIAAVAKAGFTHVRVYSTDCSTLEFVGSACAASGLKMILGVFVNAEGLSVAQAQVTAITAWAQWSIVSLVVVGNEAVFSGYCSASDLAAFITSSKASFAASGYTGPCTTTEPLDVWQANAGALCGSVDVVGCNIHPFFNSGVDSSSAGSFVKSQLDIVDGLCTGKSGIVLETGWPSAGSSNGAAVPSPSDQATAVASIKNEVGGKSVMFSFGNDLWKQPGPYGCEQSWGIMHLFE